MGCPFESGGFGYELTWRGEGEHGGSFLLGLSAADSTMNNPGTSYDVNRSGVTGARSGFGRGLVGGQSDPGRPETNGTQASDSGRHPTLVAVTWRRAAIAADT
ncbi:hypothetical protein M6D93_01585 [Jatrophihabitans telluris]|uniref:Uncharacterized protein n=1 Tax=Jatrophihabitans telluris TaxID=2038343 RepID=A0ABY4R051_9ACTN|nr:hypothetical protein [Jatrophihabitans telluris]UQX88707.1 hypothetical protein M6D93_01585 [Jatrophihabitans telluris]